MTEKQRRLLFATLTDLTIVSRDDYLRALSHITSEGIASSNDLTSKQYDDVIGHLQSMQSWSEEDRLAEINILTRPSEDPWAKSLKEAS